MLAFITTEFQKLKRYSIILVGMLGVACSPIISIVMQKIMTDVAAFLLGYISIYFKNPIIRNLYPLSAGLSIVGFNGEGFVTDTTGAYSSSQSILLGVLTMLAMLILSLIIISIPQKETLATPLSQKRRKTERKIAK